MLHYFKKDKVNNQINFNGAVVTWQLVANNTGVRILDDTIANDAPLLAELDRLATARKMGVVRISKEILDSIKKNPRLTQSPRPLGAFDKVKLVPQEPSLIKLSPPTAPSPLVVPTVSVPPQRTPESPPPIRPSMPNTSTPQPPGPIATFKPKRGRLSSLEKGAKANEGGS